MMAVVDIDENISAYEAMKADLEATSMGKWVLIHDHELFGIYDSFEQAAEEAVSRFGPGPYLIRRVGAPKRHPSPFRHR